MSTEAPITPPKKKLSVLWYLGGGLLLLIFIFFFQLFGPNPRIIVSPQTTAITAPLGPDGLPDYEQYTREMLQDGVTPENNAAVLLYQALWPGGLDPKDFAAVVMELGLEQIPDEEESLVELYDRGNRQRVEKWLQEQERAAKPPETAEQTQEGDAAEGMGTYEIPDDTRQYFNLAEQAISRASSAPWTSEQIPPLAKWVAENKKPLDLIVEATRRPRLYLPSPSLVNNERELLVQMLLPGVQTVREAGRALPARAMWHLGEGRPMEAWSDVLAVHRLANLLTQGRTLVEQLVAVAISGLACDSTLTLLDHGNLTAEQARQVQRDLAALPALRSLATSLDKGERMWALDAAVQLGSRSNRDHFSAITRNEDNFGNAAFNTVSVDWNLVLRETNRWYDKMAAAAALPDRPARKAAFAQIETDLKQLEGRLQTRSRWVAGVVSRQKRSQLVAELMADLFLPALNSAAIAEDRANNTLDLTRLAAALAVYRAEQGAYPEKLDDLVPGVLDKLPVDLYNAKPFFYQRTNDGYLLYSAGENRADDGGSSEMMNTFQGQQLNDLDEAAQEKLRAMIPAGADDMSIRLPRPKWEMPKPPPAEP
jgi:hypothetical protein